MRGGKKIYAKLVAERESLELLESTRSAKELALSKTKIMEVFSESH